MKLPVAIMKTGMNQLHWPTINTLQISGDEFCGALMVGRVLAEEMRRLLLLPLLAGSNLQARCII